MGGGGVPQPYQPTGQGQADINFQSLFQGQQPWAQGAPGEIIPNLYNAAYGIENNPYTGTLQQGANQASAWAMGPGTQIFEGGAQALSGAGNELTGQIPGVLAFGNDPQNALYNHTSQQTIDQQNAINAQSGVSGSPYAAGLDAQNLQNFNLAWGNNQLNRMSQADSTASGLSGAASGAFGEAGNLAQGATQLSYEGGQLPYLAHNMPFNADMSAWNQAAGGVNSALAPGQSLMNSLASYLGIGQNATSIGQQGQQQDFNEQASIYQGLGSLFGSFATPGGIGGSNPFGGKSGLASIAGK